MEKDPVGPGVFAAASAVVQQAAGEFTGDVAPGWDILGAANGGYLLSIAARALAATTGRAPVTITGHFLAPGKPGPIHIGVTTLKKGRRFTTASCAVRQGERELLAVLATTGEFDTDADVLLQSARPPDLPDPSTIPAFMHDPVVGMPPPFTAQVDLRINPDDAGFAAGKPSGRAHMRGWFRLRNGEPIDPFALIVAADCLPPTTFNAGLPIAWTPTLELTVHLRAVPVPGWLRLDFTTRFISNGRLEVDGLIWDGEGRLVAQSRQLALVARPPG